MTAGSVRQRPPFFGATTSHTKLTRQRTFPPTPTHQRRVLNLEAASSPVTTPPFDAGTATTMCGGTGGPRSPTSGHRRLLELVDPDAGLGWIFRLLDEMGQGGTKESECPLLLAPKAVGLGRSGPGVLCPQDQPGRLNREAEQIRQSRIQIRVASDQESAFHGGNATECV
jgi:hypothetical protein